MIEQLVSSFEQHTWFFLLTIALVSLCVGSFLNVVIYRLPKMLESQWQQECQLMLEDQLISPEKEVDEGETFNLAVPASTCPQCHTKIKPWHNIPVVSWLLLKGRCNHCQTKISVRYPGVELLTLLASMAVASIFGVTAELLPYLVLTWTLIALIFIDIDHMLLPDQLTLPLVWLGLLIAVAGLSIPAEQAIIGAALGYLSLWSVYWGFKLLTGKEGMGYGDFKLMAVFGAFLGAKSLPLIILLSSIVGLVIGVSLLAIQGKDKSTPIPFGPYIAIAGWIALLWGEHIIQAYLAYMGLTS